MRFPHPFIILVACILLAGLLTWIIPAGHYLRAQVAGRETVVPGSYTHDKPAPVGFSEVMLNVPRGFEAAADVIISILIFGGTFCVIDKTGAFKAGLLWMIARSKKLPYLVLCLVGIAFASGGAMDNMSEEIIALVPVMVFMASRLGYSKIGAVAISTGCAVIGASFSPMNPFQVGIAQKLAHIPLLSGAPIRIVFLIPAVAFWIAWVVRRTKAPALARVVAQAPALAQAAAQAAGRVSSPQPLSHGEGEDTRPADPKLATWRTVTILSLVLIAFAIMIFGIIRLDWDFNEMTAEFFVLGIVSGIIGKMGLNGMASTFVEGVREMTLAALVVGLARSVYLVLQQGRVIDTIVHALFTPLQHLPVILSAMGMMGAHVLIHLPVSSTSGQAQLTIPLLTPLADLTGMSRQVMVMAYQYGTGLSELFAPTNGALMGVLAVAGISFKDWWGFVWRPALILYGIAAVAIIAAVSLGV